MTAGQDGLFKGRHFTSEVILWALRWYLGFCCKRWGGTHDGRTATVLGADFEELGDEAGLGRHVATANVVDLPFLIIAITS